MARHMYESSVTFANGLHQSDVAEYLRCWPAARCNGRPLGAAVHCVPKLLLVKAPLAESNPHAARSGSNPGLLRVVSNICIGSRT
jgi:hypothetical protein